MSVFIGSLGRFPRWILSFRSSTKPPRRRPDCCLSPEPIETNDDEEREERRDDSKTKQETPQSLVNSSQREHKYFNRLSNNIGERKSWITQTKDALVSFFRVSCVSTTSHLSEPTPSPGWKTKGEPSWETRRTRPRSLLLLVVCALKRVNSS